MARRWSQAEDQLLRRLYADGEPVADISRRLGRSPDAVVARRRSLGIPARRANGWSRADDAVVRAATVAGLSASVIGGRLGRSPDRIRARRRTLLGPRTAARPYRPDEDAQIRRCVEGGGDLVSLAGRLGRSPDALRLHAQHLGLLHPVSRRRWAEWEDAVLRDGYTSALPYAEIARQLPHRTPTGLAARARKLALISYARRWSSVEDQRLAQLTASGRSLEDIAQRLGRTPEAIRRRAKGLGIAPPRPAPAPRRTRRWTNEEDELLRLHHALNPARLAELLGRTDVAVCRRLCVLGLRAGAGRSPHHPAGHRPDVLTSARRRSATVEHAVLEPDEPRGHVTAAR